MNLIGFFKCDLSLENYDYWQEVIQDEFQKIDMEKKNYNTWLMSFHFLTRNLNLNPKIFLKYLYKSIESETPQVFEGNLTKGKLDQLADQQQDEDKLNFK